MSEVELKSVADYGKDKIDAATLNIYNYISTENLVPNRGGISTSDYLPAKGKVSKFDIGDTLVSNIRPYFKKIWHANEIGGCSNDVIVFKPNKNKIDPKFLYYQLSKDEFFDFMMSGANGTKMPRGNKNAIPTFRLNLPPLPTQKRIASILTAYDDLIENNLKRIKLLEEIAQRTYEEWFVKFRVNGEQLAIDEDTGLPLGWEFKKAEQLFNIKIGKTPPREQENWFRTDSEGIKWASIKDINNVSVFISNTSERITNLGVEKFNMNVAQRGTVILSFKLTVGKVTIVTEDMVTNEAIAHFNYTKDCIFDKSFIYVYLKRFNYHSLGSTSSIGTAINSKIVKAMPFLVPDITSLNLFQEFANPLFDQIEQILNMNFLLKQSRDILLPRLMSGTINIES